MARLNWYEFEVMNIDLLIIPSFQQLEFSQNRALVLFLVFVLTFSFWLFYGVRIIQDRYHDYHKIVSYAVNLVDALLFVHYLAVILLEIRHLSPKYIVKMSRSPDGETRTITMGELRFGEKFLH